jgi:hypothetical protein
MPSLICPVCRRPAERHVFPPRLGDADDDGLFVGHDTGSSIEAVAGVVAMECPNGHWFYVREEDCQ